MNLSPEQRLIIEAVWEAQTAGVEAVTKANAGLLANLLSWVAVEDARLLLDMLTDGTNDALAQAKYPDLVGIATLWARQISW